MKSHVIRKPYWFWVLGGVGLILLSLEFVLYALPLEPESLFGLMRWFAIFFVAIAAVVFGVTLLTRIWIQKPGAFGGVGDFVWFSLLPAVIALGAVELLILGLGLFFVFGGSHSVGSQDMNMALNFVLTGTLVLLVVGVPLSAFSAFLLAKMVLTQQLPAD